MKKQPTLEDLLNVIVSKIDDSTEKALTCIYFNDPAALSDYGYQKAERIIDSRESEIYREFGKKKGSSLIQRAKQTAAHKVRIQPNVEVTVEPTIRWVDAPTRVIHPLEADYKFFENHFMVEFFFENYFDPNSDEIPEWTAPVSLDCNTFDDVIKAIGKKLKKNYKESGTNLLQMKENVYLTVITEEEDFEVSLEDEIEEYIQDDFHETNAATYAGFRLKIDFDAED